MSWIFIAISAHFFWALVNIGDKYIIGNKIKNPFVYLSWLALIGILIMFLIPFIDFIIPELKIFLWLILAGALYFYGGLPYIKSVQIEEVSRINIWWQLIPVFSFIISWFALGELLSKRQVVAMIILMIGGILSSFHFKNKLITGKTKIIFSKAFWLMVIACVAFAGYAVILHYIANFISIISAFVWINIIVAVFSTTLFILPKFRESFKSESRQLFKKQLLISVIGVAVLDALGLLLNIRALSLGPAALVFAMEGWQVLFVLVIATVISIFWPKILKEELDKKNLILKIVALALMIVGVVMIYTG